MLGTPGNLNRIKNICKRKSIILIEDTAWGLGGNIIINIWAHMEK